MNFIWVKGKQRPKVIHLSLNKTIKEAERLAIKERRRVFVFAIFNTVKLINGNLVWDRTDEHPKDRSEAT
jgi:hypothetical protein